MTTVCLIRHPPVAIAEGVCYGASDVRLARMPDAFSARMRARLPASYTLLSSPLSRCRDLAVQLGLPVCDARLTEMNFGQWELQPWDSLPREALDAWAADPLHFRPPGGETVAEMAARSIAALSDALTYQPRQLVIVSHGGPLRAMIGHLRKLPDDEWLSLAIPLGSLTRIAIS